MKKLIETYIRSELCINDQELIDEIIGDYFMLQKELLHQIQMAYETRDFPLLKQLAHTYKGSSANVGADMFRSIALQLQELAEAKNEIQCGKLISDLESLQKNTND